MLEVKMGTEGYSDASDDNDMDQDDDSSHVINEFFSRFINFDY